MGLRMAGGNEMIEMGLRVGLGVGLAVGKGVGERVGKGAHATAVQKSVPNTPAGLATLR